MIKNIPIVESFVLGYRRHWDKGIGIHIDNRVDSALYFPIKGRLVFEGAFGKIICDHEHPLYIPRNLKYKYYSEADTDAYLFNFQESSPLSAPEPIDTIDLKELENAHNQLNLLRVAPSARNNAKAMSILYSIMSLSLPDTASAEDSVLLPAVEYVTSHYNDPALSLDILAGKCHISKVYLHKLFIRKLGITPYKYITNVRMERAYIFLKDKKNVGQVAIDVGYNDIYTFSRAYKKHFNESPEKTKLSGNIKTK